MSFRGFKLVFPYLAFTLAIVPVGCGDENPPPPSPEEGCRIFNDAYCSRFADCDVPSSRADTYLDCMLSLELGLDCREVIELAPAFSHCIDTLRSVACAEILEDLPLDCHGALLL